MQFIVVVAVVRFVVALWAEGANELAPSPATRCVCVCVYVCVMLAVVSWQNWYGCIFIIKRTETTAKKRHLGLYGKVRRFVLSRWGSGIGSSGIGNQRGTRYRDRAGFTWNGVCHPWPGVSSL